MGRLFLFMAGIPGFICYMNQTNKEMDVTKHNKSIDYQYRKMKESELNMLVHCPAKVGGTENGCHTSKANQLIYILVSDGNLYKEKLRIFENAYKYFCKNGSMSGEGLFDSKGLPDKWVYNILNTGIHVPTIMNEYFHANGRGLSLFRTCLKEYNSCVDTWCKIKESKLIKQDFINWVMRDFNEWLNENKRIPSKK